MRVLWLSGVVLLLDQFTKWLVVRNMVRYESIPLIGDWLKLTYTRNPGMAFGLSAGTPWVVTAFAVLATVLICVYLWHVRRSDGLFRASLAMILGGAVGNIVDRISYGVLYDGLGWFQGTVVDFVHVDLYNGWVDLPLLGTRYVSLFPIWNVADMAIVGGVIGFMLFQKRFHASMETPAPAVAPATGAEIVPLDASPAPPQDEAGETTVPATHAP